MDRISYYKNFPMGTELDIAGTFIFNGIKDFNRMSTFNYESDIFHVLYSISVGIERMQKVLIVLLEDISVYDFEKTLITHSHQELHTRISKHVNLKFSTEQNKLLQLLTNFYKTCRYNRFSIETDYSKEKMLLIKYLEDNMKINIVVDELFTSTRNNDEIKEFFGKVVGKIARVYYKAISDTAREFNIYTYELQVDSPAFKIFMPDLKKNSLQQQYLSEQIALKEFLIFIMNTCETTGFYNLIKSIKPLNIDIELVQDYFIELCKGVTPQELIDEVEYLYEEEVENVKERLSLINIIGSSYLYFKEDEEDEEDEEGKIDFI